jgi:hypothetical protein
MSLAAKMAIIDGKRTSPYGLGVSLLEGPRRAFGSDIVSPTRAWGF